MSQAAAPASFGEGAGPAAGAAPPANVPAHASLPLPAAEQLSGVDQRRGTMQQQQHGKADVPAAAAHGHRYPVVQRVEVATKAQARFLTYSVWALNLFCVLAAIALCASQDRYKTMGQVIVSLLMLCCTVLLVCRSQPFPRSCTSSQAAAKLLQGPADLRLHLPGSGCLHRHLAGTGRAPQPAAAPHLVSPQTVVPGPTCSALTRALRIALRLHCTFLEALPPGLSPACPERRSSRQRYFTATAALLLGLQLVYSAVYVSALSLVISRADCSMPWNALAGLEFVRVSWGLLARFPATFPGSPQRMSQTTCLLPSSFCAAEARLCIHHLLLPLPPQQHAPVARPRRARHARERGAGQPVKEFSSCIADAPAALRFPSLPFPAHWQPDHRLIMDRTWQEQAVNQLPFMALWAALVVAAALNLTGRVSGRHAATCPPAPYLRVPTCSSE